MMVLKFVLGCRCEVDLSLACVHDVEFPCGTCCPISGLLFFCFISFAAYLLEINVDSSSVRFSSIDLG